MTCRFPIKNDYCNPFLNRGTNAILCPLQVVPCALSRLTEANPYIISSTTLRVSKALAFAYLPAAAKADLNAKRFFVKEPASAFKVNFNTNKASGIKNLASICEFNQSSLDFSKVPFELVRGSVCWMPTWTSPESTIDLYGYNTTNEQNNCTIKELQDRYCSPGKPLKIPDKTRNALLISVGILVACCVCMLWIASTKSDARRDGYRDIDMD